MRSRLKSFKNAFEGVAYAFLTQKNLRIHFCAFFLVIILGIILKITFFEWLSIITISFLVICLEMMNTAVEEVVDLYVKEYNPKAKIAKDVAAGAVLLAAFGAVIIGIIVFLPKILLYFNF